MLGRVLLTGGAGFLSRAIMRRARRDNWNCDFVVFSRDELKQAQCREKYPEARYVLGDVRNEGLLRAIMLGVDTVIHTAAMKYVPEGESNVSECISVNIGGTQTVLEAARWARVGQVVVISTDKAVEPVNVYGMTKALCERLVGESVLYPSPCVTGVRYGNVIGSTGSVIPLFQAQAARGETITITDPEMTRFWISVDEAIDLIERALDDNTASGSIIIPEPKATTLLKLAATVAPDAEIEIRGPRPGEKKHEMLMTENESGRLRAIANTPPFELMSGALAQQGSHHIRFTLSSMDAAPLDLTTLPALIEDAADV